MPFSIFTQRERKTERENCLSMMCGVKRSNTIEILWKVAAFTVNGRSELRTRSTWRCLIQSNHKSGAGENI